ncbi:hypothetical protein AWB69_03791 [Caballeronia udeis]|uniref:Uncharacterized protein n=1 Tax=Caballeronia udeis TaxID=1232866 RepID=A0A158H399_9BURK|nr:hypothetical protein AWB69_03791 [Caballeronia udeis]
MGGKSGRNEREVTRVEGIIAGLSNWCRGWYRPKVEAVKKGASHVANRWRLSAEDHTLPVRVAGADIFRMERTPGLVTPWVFTTSATVATPTDRHGYDSAPGLHGAQAVTTPGRSSPARQWTAGDAAPVSASSGRPRLGAGKHRNRRLREKASPRRFQAKHALRERPAT